MMACEATDRERLMRSGAARTESGGVLRLGRAFLHLLRMWRERAWLRRELPTIDPRMLRDIGLTRAELEREIEKPIWRL